jgi:hypothetical protein
MAQVIENPSEQNDVEGPDGLRTEVGYVDYLVFQVGRDKVSSDFERFPAKRIMLPHKIVGCQHPMCAAPLGLETKEPVIAADVEHRLTGERCIEKYVGDGTKMAYARPAWSDNAASEINLMEPG